MTKYILMALALGAYTGCGGGGDTLTEEQTMQALTAVGSAAGVSFGTINSEITATSGQVTINNSAACPNGGTARASGQVQVNGSQDLRYSLDLGVSNCQVSTIVMNGQLNTAGTLSNQRLSVSLTGQVTFSGGLSGTCVFDYQLTADTQAGTFSYSGKACGRSINVQITPGQ